MLGDTCGQSTHHRVRAQSNDLTDQLPSWLQIAEIDGALDVASLCRQRTGTQRGQQEHGAEQAERKGPR